MASPEAIAQAREVLVESQGQRTNDAVVILDAGELAVAVRTMSGHDLGALPTDTLRRCLGLVRAGLHSGRALERRLARELAKRGVTTPGATP